MDCHFMMPNVHTYELCMSAQWDDQTQRKPGSAYETLGLSYLHALLPALVLT